MRLFVLATAITIAAVSAVVTGCASRGLVVPGPTAPYQYSGAPYLPDGYCGGQPGCAPPEVYPGGYAPPGPQVYSDPEPGPVPEPYSRQYGPPVYSGPTHPYWGDQTYGSTNHP